MPISFQPLCTFLCLCVCRRCVCMHTHSHTHALHCCAFHLCLPSSPGDGCCEIQTGPVVFDTLVFWGNSRLGAVDQEDLVRTNKCRKQKYQGASDVMAQWWCKSPFVMLGEMLLCKKLNFYSESNALLNNNVFIIQYDLYSTICVCVLHFEFMSFYILSSFESQELQDNNGCNVSDSMIKKQICGECRTCFFMPVFPSFSAGPVCVCSVLHHAQPAVLAD